MGVALVMSQVVLSIALPVPMIALIIFRRARTFSGIATGLINYQAALNNMRFESTQCQRAIDLNKRLAIIGIKLQNEVRC